jgi:[ribulose-bisphosphate carboxylase]-lysine N-methyltransferase
VLRFACPQALRVRLGEKRALQAALETYQARARKVCLLRSRLAWLTRSRARSQTLLSSAPELEYYQERRLRSLKLMDEGGKNTYDPFNDSFTSW